MEGECNTSLSLTIGGSICDLPAPKKSLSPVQFNILFPKQEKEEEEDQEEEEEEEEEDQISRLRSKSVEDHDEARGSIRKKLRLSKDQVMLLEDSFRDQNTLNQIQKQELSQRLNIQPRQVEVWFQNRRARSKLKQTEVDCENLKKCCDRLMEENRRLKEELQRMRTLPSASQLQYSLELSASEARTICPSCERTAAPATRTGKRKTSTASAAAGGSSFNMKGFLLSVNRNSLLSL